MADRIYYDAVDPRVDHGHIFRTDVDAQRTEAITSDDVPAYGPQLSPDGTLLSYITWDGSVSDLWVARADGSEPHLLIHLAQSLGWSNDGSVLLATSADPTAGPNGGIVTIRRRRDDASSGPAVRGAVRRWPRRPVHRQRRVGPAAPVTSRIGCALRRTGPFGSHGSVRRPPAGAGCGTGCTRCRRKSVRSPRRRRWRPPPFVAACMGCTTAAGSRAG